MWRFHLRSVIDPKLGEPFPVPTQMHEDRCLLDAVSLVPKPYIEKQQ